MSNRQPMAVSAEPTANGPKVAASADAVPVWVIWLVVYLVVRAFWTVSAWSWRVLDSDWVSAGLLKLALWVVPCMIALETHRWWVGRSPDVPRVRDRGQSGSIRALGLSSKGLEGLTLGLLATIPMGAAVIIAGGISAQLGDAGAATIGAFAEEVLFRGFLFWGLRRAGWRLLPSVLLSALAFGLAHSPSNAGTFVIAVAGLLFGSGTYLSDFLADFWRAALRLAPFFAGGVLFAWLTHRWAALWPAIGLHACLNLWWELAPGTYAFASLGRVALEPLPIAHAVAVLIAIGITLIRTRASDAR